MKTHLQLLRIFFIILAVLQFFNVLYFGFMLFAIMSAPASGGAAIIFIFALIFLLQVAVFIFNILAAINIIRATRYRLCVTACILNLIPFLSCCWVAGIPVGIYGLIVLLGTEGRAVFQAVASGRTLEMALAERVQINRVRRQDDATDIEVNGDWDQGRIAEPKPAVKPPAKPPANSADSEDWN